MTLTGVLRGPHRSRLPEEWVELFIVLPSGFLGGQNRQPALLLSGGQVMSLSSRAGLGSFFNSSVFTAVGAESGAP